MQTSYLKGGGFREIILLMQTSYKEPAPTASILIRYNRPSVAGELIPNAIYKVYFYAYGTLGLTLTQTLKGAGLER